MNTRNEVAMRDAQAGAVSRLPALKQQIEDSTPKFEMQLGSDMPVGRFVQSIYLSLEKEPKLKQCDPVSLIDACSRAANDGLLLDGREAALVIFQDRERGPIAQYIPMYQGLLKRVYKSGLVSKVSVHAVYDAELEHDQTLGRPRFVYEAGYHEKIVHTPMIVGEKGNIRLFYSVATMRDGTVSYEVMTVEQIIKIAKLSRKNVDGEGRLKGLWAHPLHKVEMFKKTVLRRHTKYLPKDDLRLSSVIDAMDEAAPLPENMPEDDPLPTIPRKRNGGAAERLNRAEADEVRVVDHHDPETGEVKDADAQLSEEDTYEGDRI